MYVVGKNKDVDVIKNKPESIELTAAAMATAAAQPNATGMFS
jgi:hypothetical protein